MEDTSWIGNFRAYLLLEKGYSENTVNAYTRDLKKFLSFLVKEKISSPLTATSSDLEYFSQMLGKAYSPNAQARILSGVGAFYQYLLLTNQITHNPTELLEFPKQSRPLPEVLEVREIEQMIAAIDLSRPDGHRNLAMVEVLYGCGLRVSELCDLLISDIIQEEGLLKVTGKGRKQRLVPIGKHALNALRLWITESRPHFQVKKGYESVVFLNRRGTKISRVMVFYVLKGLAERAGIKKNIYPHILRHSFATHMVQGGADLRMVQEMLGHSSITTTEIYSHLDRSFLHETLLSYHPRNKKQS
ncbi:MAG: tyrosine recombinase XerD [Bacteroidia bacterium]|nr:tyrosine recombinase XerD [Bacteroidia bacterium]